MKEFKKYQHLERLGTSEVENINLGECYIFPKIDGTNGSIWINSSNTLSCASRKRILSKENDNAGFYSFVESSKEIHSYLYNHPNHRLFGEWLVPHSLKTYKEDAWKRFYVFDVVEDLEEVTLHGEKFKYLHYNKYQPILEEYNLDYIPSIAKITNGSYEQFINQFQHNTFLIKEGKGVGEGIVIKNYSFKNKYGRATWAKLVTNEFKEKHIKQTGGHEVKGKKLVEEEIATKYTTEALCNKVLAKIKLEKDGFSSKDIPQLLNTIYYDIIKEESWNFLKENKNPTINFKTLKHLILNQVKLNLPHLF